MSAAKKLVEMKIGSKKVVIFSKSHCGFCRKAKSALRKYIPADLGEDDYEVVELDERDDGDAIQAYMKTLTGGSSVPRVFINGKFVGGGDETQALHSKGKLKALLTQ